MDDQRPSRVMLLKRRVFAVLEMTDSNDRITRWFGACISLLIVASIVAFMLETVTSIKTSLETGLRVFEIVVVVIFSIEYVARVWSCTSSERYRHPILGRLRYALTPMVLVDLLSIAPFYVSLGLTTTVDTRFLRALRLLRLFRVFKLGRYMKALTLIGRVIRSRKEELAICLVVVVLLMILASSGMYMVENAAQPDKFSSIPETLWWSIATLTTVGYGDVYPVTTLGKILGGVIAILGIGLFALPTGILASGFSEALRDRRKAKACCPHCGRELHE